MVDRGEAYSGGQVLMQQFSTSPIEMAASVWRNRSLIVQMTKREVVGRYRGSLLGLGWSLFHPLLMLVIYTFVFSIVFRARWPGMAEESTADFALLLFVGMILHGFFAECVNRAPSLVLSNPNYVKKVVFPLENPAVCRYGVGGLSRWHQSGRHAASANGLPWRHSLDHRTDSVRTPAIAVRDTWDSVVPVGLGSVYTRYRSNHRHSDHHFLIYFSRVLSYLSRPSVITDLAQAQSVDFRNRGRPRCFDLRSHLRFDVVDMLRCRQFCYRLGRLLVVSENAKRVRRCHLGRKVL